MTSIDDEISKQIASRIAEAMSRAFQLGCAEVDRLFSALGADLDTIVRSPEQRIELQRRLAETRIALLYKRADAAPFFDNAWDEIERLGFSNAEREATALVYRAKYLARRKQDVEQEATLVRLGRIIDDVLAQESSELAGHFRRVLEGLRVA